MKIRTMDPSSKPREKATLSGIGSLSDAELLALVLQSGTRGKNAIELAQELLEKCNGLYALSNAKETDLKVKGIGKAKALKLVAAFELGRRSLQAGQFHRTFSSSAEILKGFATDIAYLPFEKMKCVYLDRKKRMLRVSEFTLDRPDAVEAPIKEVLNGAIMSSASFVYLLHNHPSGNVSPSKEDLLCTQTLLKILIPSGVVLSDSLTVSGRKAYSIRDGKELDLS